jgi:hypothetical protein
MPLDLIVSIRQNSLRVSVVDKKQFKTASEKLSEDIVVDSDVKNVDSLVESLKKLIAELTTTSRSKMRVSFLVDPQDVDLRFIASNKKEGSFEDFMVSEIKAKLEGKNIEDYYFSYEKLAPFVYQMEAVRKDLLEKFIEISDKAGLSLYSLIPWALFMPRYVGASEPSIFIIQQDDKKVLVLSELQGIFFTGVFADDTTEAELNKLVHELAFYKREKPIKRVYTLGCSDVNLEGDYKIAGIDLPGELVSVERGFEMHTLANYMLDNPDRYASSQLNLLSLLPLPVAETKNRSLVYVGATVGMLLLVVGGYFGFSKLSASRSNQNNANSNVLSETVEVKETSPVIEVKETTPSVPAVKIEDLKTADLKIMVQNATDVAGLASKTKGYLEKFGYTVAEPGNAATTEEKSIVRFKKSKLAYKELLISDIKEKFPDIVIEDTLKEDEKFDALFLVGKSNKL